jgi:hypothetical protein
MEGKRQLMGCLFGVGFRARDGRYYSVLVDGVPAPEVGLSELPD